MVDKDGSTISVNVRGVNQELWRWLKGRAAVEGKNIGKMLSEVLDEYRRNLEKS